ncbi:nramp2 [Scenedesmus sp. PABB004]|nr:nramp2 [Scenedesmus sp. PABB004]
MARGFLARAARIMGPAFLVSVAYMDPGNLGAAIEAGSRHGYQLVWVVVLSNLIAILLQTLAARLGLVTGKHLAQVCREAYPPAVCLLLWVLCEISIVALDLTMVLGTAIGLNLLLGWRMLPCILLTGLDALLLLLLVPRQGVRSSEQVTVGLLVMVLGCFAVDLVLSKPPLRAVLGGLVPRLSADSVYAAVCLLGANVMPHNFFLHSALVAGQARGAASTSLRRLCLYNFLDIAAALGLALVVNVAVLLVAAATFHQAGIVVETLQAAHDLMERILSSSAAPAAFGLALLCAGQLSTFTGTIAGQVVLRGFLGVRLPTWLRRVATRGAAVLPAALLQYHGGDAATYRFLLVAQVVLALQLPFTLIPLIKATSSARLMGSHRSSAALAAAAWAASALVFTANLLLFAAQLAPGAALVPPVSAGGPDSAAHQYLDNLAGLAWARPGRFLLLLALLLAAAGLLALQLWMLLTPLSDAIAPAPLIVAHGNERGARASGKAGAGAGDGRASRHVTLGWSVPGVREWLLGTPADDLGGAAPRHGLDEAVGWPSALELAAHSRPAAVAHRHPGHTAAEQAFGGRGAQQQSGSEAGEAQPLLPLEPQTPSDSGAAASEGPQEQPAAQCGQPGSPATAKQAAAQAAARALEQQQQQQRELECEQEQEQEREREREREQEQEGEQAGAAASWDEMDLDSFTLSAHSAHSAHGGHGGLGSAAAQPSSPHASSEAASYAQLGADREVWLDAWPAAPAPPSPRSPSWRGASLSRASSSDASSLSALTGASQQQRAARAPAAPAGGARALAARPGAAAGAAGGGGRSGAGSGGSSNSSLSKGGRRALAAGLDAFWGTYFDSHGGWVGDAAAAPRGGSSGSAQHARKRPPPGSACCRCGGAAAGGGGGAPGRAWCCSCAMALLQHVQDCVSELLEVPGAAQVLTPASVLGAPPAPAAGDGGEQPAATACGLLLADAWAQLPAPLAATLRSVLPAAAGGTLIDAVLATRADWQAAPEPAAAPACGATAPGMGASAALCAAAPRVLAGWGAWCVVVLLVLGSCEVRPELWGRIAAVLNRLQGVLTDVAGGGGSGSGGSGSGGGSGGGGGEQQQLSALLLALLQQLEVAVAGRASPGAPAAPAPRPGASASGGHRPRPPPGHRAALALVLGGLMVAAPLMLGGCCSGAGGGLSGCRAAWLRRGSAVLLAR